MCKYDASCKGQDPCPYIKFCFDKGPEERPCWRYYHYVQLADNNCIVIDADKLYNKNGDVVCPHHNDVVLFSIENYKWKGESSYGWVSYIEKYHCYKCESMINVEFSSYGG